MKLRSIALALAVFASPAHSFTQEQVKEALFNLGDQIAATQNQNATGLMCGLAANKFTPENADAARTVLDSLIFKSPVLANANNDDLHFLCAYLFGKHYIETGNVDESGRAAFTTYLNKVVATVNDGDKKALQKALYNQSAGFAETIRIINKP